MRLDLKRILVPTDFSPPSQAALETAIELARRFGATLTLFHAHDLPAYVFPDGVMPVSPEILAELERSMLAELNRLAMRVRAAAVAAETRTGVGAHDVEILRCAEEIGADMIVMGTHGRTGIRHALLGSVAEKVVRRSRCPVLTVRALEEQTAAHP
jgi:nucleotide-binding universal stress UspA family protein